MRIGTITNAKIARDGRTSAVMTNRGAVVVVVVVVSSIMNDGRITTAAGLANAPNMATTSRVTQTTVIVANVPAMTSGVPFTRDAEISERECGAIGNTVRSAPGYVAATS